MAPSHGQSVQSDRTSASFVVAGRSVFVIVVIRLGRPLDNWRRLAESVDVVLGGLRQVESAQCAVRLARVRLEQDRDVEGDRTACRDEEERLVECVMLNEYPDGRQQADEQAGVREEGADDLCVAARVTLQPLLGAR